VVELLIPMHGIGGRGDLPVPLWLAIYSAGAAVAVSFSPWGRSVRDPGSKLLAVSHLSL
jgi:hypothetical protein